MMIEGILAVAAFMGAVEDDWVRTRGNLVVTSASIFHVNRAQTSSPENHVTQFKDSFFSLHRKATYPEKKYFVLTSGKHLQLLNAEGKPGLTEADLVIDKEKFLTLLREANVQIDPSSTSQLHIEEFRLVKEMTEAASDKGKPIRNWVILNKSLLKNGAGPKVDDATITAMTSAVDRSTLLEWGNPETVESALKSLEATPAADAKAEGKSADAKAAVQYSEQKIYEKHFDKMPVQAKVFVSSGGVFNGKRSDTEAPLDGMYLVHSKFDKGDVGYLLFMTGEDGRSKDAKADNRRKMIALEATGFSVASGTFTAQINAECFLNQIVQSATGKSFKLPKLDTAPENAPKMLVLAGDKEKSAQRWDIKLVLSAGAKAAASTKSGERSASVPASEPIDVDYAENPLDSYSIEFSPGADIAPRLDASTPIQIYDKSCKLLQVVEGKSVAAVSKEGTKLP